MAIIHCGGIFFLKIPIFQPTPGFRGIVLTDFSTTSPNVKCYFESIKLNENT